ncbi:type III PLP-dependent enzyme [Nocardioides sp.]|uniref:type III PLP-dependent enzyme n=1 Tax=Nocardioides sp. TaxID=35761 RepID=UPI0035679CD9
MSTGLAPAPAAAPVSAPALALARDLTQRQLPAYVHDLGALRAHVRTIRTALPTGLELYYAAKANSEPPVLSALAGLVDGFDVSSGGELAHVRRHRPDVPLALSGPGKTPDELREALAAGVERIHVESLHELAVLDALATRPVSVLLRVNLPVPDDVLGDRALTMGGSASPFGLAPADAEEALRRSDAGALPHLRILGIHAHLASGLSAAPQIAVARTVLTWARALFDRHALPLCEVNVGGGMGVDYAVPAERFDWAAYGDGMARLLAEHPGVAVRIEPGRAIAAYSGWYVTDVLDVKHSHGRDFAVVRGGTHHLRTPATKGHDQPCRLLPIDTWEEPWPRPEGTLDRVDLVGQLCTPKDLLARDVAAQTPLRAGDRVAFALAGAYAWNISHHDFLMHLHPTFHHLD